MNSDEKFGREKIMSLLCKHMDIGSRGRMFGGQMLFYLDEAATIYAKQLTVPGTILVTYRLSETIFRRGVVADEIITFYCHNPRFTESSITFKIIVETSGELCLETEATLVAVDQDGKKTKIHPENH